ncbi:SpoIIIAH-like family protein [Mycoplasmatota bacterium]|nr:SpoIIIAH-like family protein [Mycoplasmatota bacterium]
MKPQGKVTIFMVVMIVMLSIYYFMLPDNKNVDVGTTTTDQTDVTINKSAEYEQLRAELNESRQTMITTLQGVLASTNVTVEDKNVAIESIQRIQTLVQNEGILETQIANLGYDDVFVLANDTEVKVSVYVDNLTIEEVNQIILMSKSQFGPTADVIVQYTIIDVN